MSYPSYSVRFWSPAAYHLLSCLIKTFIDSEHCLSREDTKIHIEAGNDANFITKAQARKLTQQIAHGLRYKFNIGASGPGRDVVVAISSGQPLLPMLFYGVVAAGGVYSAASSSFTTSELVRQIRQGSSNLIVCSSDTQDVAIAAAKECGVPLSRVLCLKSNPRWTLTAMADNQNCISAEKLDWKRITNKEELENSLVCLLYSSGTTGPPKGCLSVYHYIAWATVRLIYLRSSPISYKYGFRDCDYRRAGKGLHAN
jgi:4-coumarate--CoA ligase